MKHYDDKTILVHEVNDLMNRRTELPCGPPGLEAQSEGRSATAVGRRAFRLASDLGSTKSSDMTWRLLANLVAPDSYSCYKFASTPSRWPSRRRLATFLISTARAWRASERDRTQREELMRKIINSTYVTLDGVIEGPHLWPAPDRPSDERFGRIQTDLALSCDALLMGRHTYDGFAPVWPMRSGDPLSDQINAMRKYVVSTTLKDPDWNNTHVIDGDVAAEITRLKQAPGKNIVQYGFGAVSRLLLEHGLLDELRLWVHPLIVGAGRPSDLLFGTAPAVGFNLTDTTTLDDGIVLLSYQTDKTLPRAA